MHFPKFNENNPMKDENDLLSFEKTDSFKYLVKLIKETFTHITDEQIQNALDVCLQELEPPREKDKFILRFKKELGV